MLKCIFLVIAILAAGSLQAATIIDHTCEDLSQIPAVWIDAVQDNIQSHYAHTSHGGQLTYGITFIEQGDPTYAYAIGTRNLPEVPGAYCVFDGQETASYITPELYWQTAAGLQLTRNVLNNNPTIDTSMWCWCCQCNSYNETQVQVYLDAMMLLESEYPDITFIYFTGNSQSDGSSGYNRYLRNNQIRDHCIANDRVLYDFADLDSWWFNPSTSLWEHSTYVYNSTDVPVEHPEFNGNEFAHTTTESCEQKGRAWWWMMAVLAGWSGTGITETEEPAGYSIEIDSPNPSTGPVLVSFNLPVEQNVSLQLFDITGRLAGIPAMGIHAGGNHQIVIDDIDEGVYFIRMTAGSYSATRKLIILN